jgi:tetratricopeptide (TPR) repeat protein
MRRSVLVGLLVACGLAAADDPKPDPKKPPYERLLAGDDLKRAAELGKKIVEAEEAERYDEAIKFCEELLVLRTRVQGADHWETVNQKWYSDAVRRVADLSAEQRAGWRKAKKGGSEVGQLGARGQYAKAEPLLQDYRRWCEQILGERHPHTALCYHSLARNLFEQGRYADAERLGQKALGLQIELLGEGHPDTAASYVNLASTLTVQGRSADALPLFQRALDLNRGLLGDNHHETAVSYTNLALNLTTQGRYAEAQPLLQRALDLFRGLHGEKHPFVAFSYDNLAGILYGQGRYADAQPLLQRALDFFRELHGEKHPQTARLYNNLALNLTAQEKYAEALPLLRRTLDLRRELLGEKHPKTAEAYSNLAYNLDRQGRHAEGLPLHQRALELNRELLGEKHPDTATSYNKLASNLDAQGRRADTLVLYQQSLDVYRELLGERHIETARGYKNLAHGLTARGEYAEALPLLLRAAAGYEATRLGMAGRGLDRAVFGAEDSPYRFAAAVQARLGNASGGWTAAEADLARGLSDEAALRRGAALTPTEQKEHATLAARLGQLQPRILQLVPKPKPTEEEREELAGLQAERRKIEERLADLAAGPSKRELATLAEVQSVIPADAALVLWVDVSAGGVQEHWGCVVRRTGNPTWEQLPGTGLIRNWTTEDNVLPERLRGVLASGTASAADIDALARKLHAQRIAPLAKHLAGVKALYVVPVNAMAGVPVEVLTAEYTIGYVPSGTFLARLKNRTPPAASGLLALADPVFTRADARPVGPRPLPPGGLLVTQVAPESAAARARFQPGDVLVSYAGIELASVEKLTEAIQAHATAKEVTVTVWREGVDKPFARTVPPGRLGVVLDRQPARDALADRRKADALLASLRGGGWKDLPGTRVEVALLAGLFGPSATVLLDSAASEQRLDELRAAGRLRDFRYLHLATHGEGNDHRAFESVLILAQDGLAKDPLPRPGEPFINGQLTANEVLEFWRLDAELVTLSACETALGRKGGGDGLLGFAQAFLTAGSRSICLSLWKVDDTATALLMTRFYQNLLGKRAGLRAPMPKAEALAEAKRWLRELPAEEALQLTAAATHGIVRGSRGKDEELRLAVPATNPKLPGKDVRPFAHPRFWAAFVLVGDPS